MVKLRNVLALVIIFQLTVFSTGSALPLTTVRYVAPGGACAGLLPCYATVQAAIDAAASGDPGIVADDMDVSEGVERGFRRALDACAIGDVADHAMHGWPEIVQALDRGGQRFGLDVGQHHLHAGFGKGAAHRQSDAAGPSRDKGSLAGELPHFVLRCVRLWLRPVIPTCMIGRGPIAVFE